MLELIYWKSWAGIPEDDPRNPVIDNVGDNVGDCRYAADLFETYAVTIVEIDGFSQFFPGDMAMMIYPLTIEGACILTSIVNFCQTGKSECNGGFI